MGEERGKEVGDGEGSGDEERELGELNATAALSLAINMSCS